MEQQNRIYAIRIFLTAFSGGILTLGLEIVAGRVLTPFFGSSLHQWAALIGVILLAYALGYEAYDRINRWGPVIPFALAGLYVLSLPFWLSSLLDYLLRFPLSIASIGGAFFATGLPSILWASTLPFLQKQNAHERTATRVLTWSAGGNLVGVWGVAFLSIPVIGTRFTLMSLGLLSLFLSFLWTRKPKPLQTSMIVLAIATLSALLILGKSPFLFQTTDAQAWANQTFRREDVKAHWLKVRDSAYQQITIWTGELAQKTRTALMLNGNVQFIWSRDEKLTQAGKRYEYYNYATAAAYWTSNGAAKSMLVLGVAGGIVPWQVRQFLPDIEVTGFELDSTLAEMSQETLPLSQITPINLKIGDARQLLQQTQKKFDYILIDCYLSSYIPFHLTTKEFFDIIRAHLNPGGIVATNYHSIFATSDLLASLEKTMASSFGTVVSLDLPSGITLAIVSNEDTSFEERFRTATSSGPFDLSLYNLEALNLVRQTLPPISSDPSILTDDHNNTEQLLFDTRRLVQVQRIL